MGIRRFDILCTISIAAACGLTGCGTGDYAIEVSFPGNTGVEQNGRVFLDGREVGYVDSVTSSGTGQVLRLVLPDAGKGVDVPRRGVAAYAHNGALYLVNPGGPATETLPSGAATQGRIEEPPGDEPSLATWVVGIACGILFLFLIFLLRGAFRFGIVLFALIVSLAAGVVFNSEASRAIAHMLSGADGDLAGFIRDADPRVVAFFAAAAAIFVFLTMLLALAFRARKDSK